MFVISYSRENSLVHKQARVLIKHIKDFQTKFVQSKGCLSIGTMPSRGVSGLKYKTLIVTVIFFFRGLTSIERFLVDQIYAYSCPERTHGLTDRRNSLVDD